jgi:hypothetical protein
MENNRQRYYLYDAYGKWTVADSTYIIVRPIIPYTSKEIAQKICSTINALAETQGNKEYPLFI